MRKTLIGCFLIAGLLLFSSSFVVAANYQPGYDISDGKSGRRFAEWSQAIAERKVESVSIILQKKSGGSDTYVNLRFAGSGTFENGKREYLDSTNLRTIRWNVNQNPHGQPLVLKAYNGVVHVKSVRVTFHGDKKPLTKPKPISEDDVLPMIDSSRDENAVKSRCRRTRIKDPKIKLGRMRKSGGIFSGKYRVDGSIRGNCINEAGYYEDGRLKEKITFPFDDSFRREEFNVRVRSGREGEIRAYTTDGREEVIDVDELIKAQERR